MRHEITDDVAMTVSSSKFLFTKKMETKYHFTKIKAKKFYIINDKSALDYLHKWSMKGQLHLITYSFNEAYQPHLKNEFAREFFTNPDVIVNINAAFPKWSYNKEQVRDVEVEEVPCTQLSMSFFDRITNPDNNIVRQGGSLHHCVDDVIDEFIIADELRKMILDENSDNYGLYNEKERKELLFRIFQHLILGGKWCQFEDHVEPYLDTAKMLYKDLVQVEKNPDTGDIQIRSLCIKIKISEGKKSVFPQEADHIQNFAYLMIDPVLRHTTLFAHEYGGQF